MSSSRRAPAPPIAGKNCDEPVVDYKDVDNLRRFLTVNGQILSRKRTGYFAQCQMALKAADVSHCTKTRRLHLEWTNRITAEFFNQGGKRSVFRKRACTHLVNRLGKVTGSSSQCFHGSRDD